MIQNMAKRPRVAAIGLDESQIESIAALCGTLRPADSLEEYLKKYNWTETDITILGDGIDPVAVRGNVLTIEPLNVTLMGHPSVDHIFSPSLEIRGNTEREMRISKACPERYRALAVELARRLDSAEDPPITVAHGGFPKEIVSILVETTSGLPIALRCGPTNKEKVSEDGAAIALALPKEASLSAWFQAFLADIHELDQAIVPQAPPRLENPLDWYTPEERVLAKRISEIANEVEQLRAEREQIETDLDTASEKADAGIRRCIWADGDDLVAAVGDIFEKLGFVVRHMDAEQEQGKPKREDLRLTLADHSRWEAIAEVKGYTSGTRTNDARQVREYRDRYIIEKGRTPDLTLWVANPYRAMDPSSRPVPDGNVGEASANIETVYVLATDLYRLWASVAAGSLENAQAIQQLIDAAPGLWSPTALDADRHNSH